MRTQDLGLDLRGDPLLILALPFAVAGGLAPFLVAWLASDNLLVTAMKDDGFYFLVLARNLAQGHGLTFDGISPTNGFHPLWVFLLAPFMGGGAASDLTGARLALTLSGVLHIGGAAAVYAAVRSLAHARSAMLAGFFFLANPLGVYLAVSGMESPLVSLLVALLAFIYVRVRKGEAAIARPGTFVALGVLAGLCMLARTDLALLVGPVFAGILLFVAGRQRRHLPGLAAATGIAALTVLPWLAWNVIQFGTIVQVSARAHHLHSLMRRSLNVSPAPGALLTLGFKVIEAQARRTAGRLRVPVLAVVALVVPLMAWAALWLRSLRQPERGRELVRRLLWMDAFLLYAIGFLGGCFFVLGHLRSWYLAGPLAVLAILMGVIVGTASGAGAGFAKRAPRGRLLSNGVYAIALLGLAPLWWVFGREMAESNENLHAWREAAAWASAHTEPSDRVASFNTGAFAYLTPRTVVNLDCVINNRGIAWLERRDLVGYIRSEDIRYVIDHPSWANMYFRGFAERDRDALVPVDTLRSKLIVYAVRY